MYMYICIIIILEGVDYSYQNHIYFDQGEKTKSLIVSHVDDDKVEINEKYNLTIKPSLLHSRAIVGEYGTTTITIKDDDGKYIRSYTLCLLFFHDIFDIL